MKTFEKTKTYAASPEEVFDCLDNLSVTGMHMTKSSMPMMGSKMKIEFLSPHQTGLNTKYRCTGKVLWMPLDFTVVVTEWVRGREKSWETTGSPKMIIMSWFKMELIVSGNNLRSGARLSISYEKPKGILNRALCFLLAGWYCRWCLKQMLNDAKKQMAWLRCLA